ncbi:MAG: alpha/beta fold hydrolase [Planctomycetaceae bacterium]
MPAAHSISPPNVQAVPNGSHELPAAGASLTDQGGCPPPLAWRDVVQAFCEQRQIHEWSRDGQAVTVSTLGQGPPLYLLNGVFGDATMSALLVWLLQEEHTCVVCDWPGIRVGRAGDSAPQRLANLARSVLGAADRLGHGRFALHGTSFGCLVGLQMMLDAPERIERASLQGGSAARRLTRTERGLLGLARRSSRSLGQVPFVSAILRQNHRSWFPPFDETRWNFFEQLAADTPLRQAADAALIAGRVDLSPRLAEIQTPVLVILCEGDGAVSAQAQQELARRLPCSSVETLDNCGALPQLTHPHRLAKLLRAFRDDARVLNAS